MTWKQRYRVASYLRSSLWIIAVTAVVLEQIFAALVRALDVRLDWGGLGLGIEGAKALCNTVVTFSLSFFVFTFGSLLVAIQVVRRADHGAHTHENGLERSCESGCGAP